jgi:hypothetical protein
MESDVKLRDESRSVVNGCLCCRDEPVGRGCVRVWNVFRVAAGYGPGGEFDDRLNLERACRFCRCESEKSFQRVAPWEVDSVEHEHGLERFLVACCAWKQTAQFTPCWA